jgi:hypothetical protein
VYTACVYVCVCVGGGGDAIMISRDMFYHSGLSIQASEQWRVGAFAKKKPPFENSKSAYYYGRQLAL